MRVKYTPILLLTDLPDCLTFAAQFKKKSYGNNNQREYRTAQ
jgi:hypothetical protein